MDNSVLITLICFLSLVISSDANLTGVGKHDMPGMEMGTPPPEKSPGAGDPMNNMHSPQMNHMMMHMTFFWGTESEILFSGFPGARPGLYGLALVAVFLLAVFSEWLTHSRWVPAGGPRSAGAGIVQAAAHTVRVGVAYLVMLALMSFNGGVFIVAVAGHGFGFLVFGSRVFRDTAGQPEDPAKVVC